MNNPPTLYPKDAFPDQKISPQILMTASMVVRCGHVMRGDFAAAKIVATIDGEPIESYVMVPQGALDQAVETVLAEGSGCYDEGSAVRLPLLREEAAWLRAGKLASLDVMLEQLSNMHSEE